MFKQSDQQYIIQHVYNQRTVNQALFRYQDESPKIIVEINPPI